MLQNYNRYKVLKVFLDNPLENFGLREISRIVNLAPVSVLNYLAEFEKEGVIIKSIKKGNPIYFSNRDSEKFRLYQKISIFYELNNSGLVDYLWDKLSPETLILYGSYSRGEAVNESDIDIFVIGKEKRVDLGKFEKEFQKRINVLFESRIDNVSNELKNNLVNGIILKGYLYVLDENKNNKRQGKGKVDIKDGKR